MSTADEALQARKDGQELSDFFARRKKELRRAEEPRPGTMDQPETLNEKAEAIANGNTTESSESKPGHGDRSLSQVPEEDLSETTVVATPEEEGKNAINTEKEKHSVNDTELQIRSPTTVA